MYISSREQLGCMLLCTVPKDESMSRLGDSWQAVGGCTGQYLAWEQRQPLTWSCKVGEHTAAYGLST